MGQALPPEKSDTLDKRGLVAALISPLLLGFAPVLGKFAYQGGSDPFTVAAMRTVVAAAILWIFYLLFWRRYIFIYPAGLLGCVVVGVVNGIGSLFYYNGLSYLNNASVAQLLNATYLIWVVVMLRLNGQLLNQRTLLRTILAFVAVMMLTGGLAGQVSWLGAGLMIGNAILFAGTVLLSQRVLYEMPSQTVTLYVLTTMAIVVVMARAVYRLEWIPQSSDAVFAIVALGVTTALSRLALFLGVKRLGSLQTVLLGIFETAVAVIMANVFLHEQLTSVQWVGVGILVTSLVLVRRNDLTRSVHAAGSELTMTDMAFAFNQMAFSHAFGQKLGDDITPEDLQMIRKMMEAPPRYDDPQKDAPKAEAAPIEPEPLGDPTEQRAEEPPSTSPQASSIDEPMEVVHNKK